MNATEVTVMDEQSETKADGLTSHHADAPCARRRPLKRKDRDEGNGHHSDNEYRRAPVYLPEEDIVAAEATKCGN